MSSLPVFREMGRIVRPHGVLGEVKVAPETDDPDRFYELETIYVGADEASAVSFDIVSVRLQPSKYGITVLLMLAGVSGREAAEALCKNNVYADVADLPALEDGEYYLSDLVGLKAETLEGTEVGVVEDVLEGPGQDLLVIRTPAGGRVMVPLVPELVPDIDLDAGRIGIDPVDGLL
jgi:16S rRNA processing protein RimM